VFPRVTTRKEVGVILPTTSSTAEHHDKEDGEEKTEKAVVVLANRHNAERVKEHDDFILYFLAVII
jgi:hypothetical protein